MDFNIIDRGLMIYCYFYTIIKDRIPLNDHHTKFINSANKSKLNALLILAGVFTPEYQSAVAVRKLQLNKPVFSEKDEIVGFARIS